MVVYSYDGKTGRFIAGEMADPDPLEPGVWLIPANATTEMPPAENGPLWPYWTGSSWQLLDEGSTVKEREMRALRNHALVASDWTQLRDVPMDGKVRGAWAYYRQQLRDLPTNPDWPFVAMPVKPTQ